MRNLKKILIVIVALVALLGVVANVYAGWIKCKDNFTKCTEGGCESPTRADNCTLYSCIDGRNVTCDTPAIAI